MWADRREPSYCWPTPKRGRRKLPITSGGPNSMPCPLCMESGCLKKSFMLPWSRESYLAMAAIPLGEMPWNSNRSQGKLAHYLQQQRLSWHWELGPLPSFWSRRNSQDPPEGGPSVPTSEPPLSWDDAYVMWHGYPSLNTKRKFLKFDDNACSQISSNAEGVSLSSAPFSSGCIRWVSKGENNPHLAGMLWASSVMIPLKPLVPWLVRRSAHFSFQMFSLPVFYIIEIALHARFCLI